VDSELSATTFIKMTQPAPNVMSGSNSLHVNPDMLGPRGATIDIHTVRPPIPEMGTRGTSTQVNGDMLGPRGPTINIHPLITVLPPTGPNTQDLPEPSL